MTRRHSAIAHEEHVALRGDRLVQFVDREVMELRGERQLQVAERRSAWHGLFVVVLEQTRLQLALLLAVRAIGEFVGGR